MIFFLQITDGEKGMNEIQQWLINIQARAPNSPVIIVGTHMDVVKDEFPPSFSEYLQQRIREKFITIADPEKFGLPRVLESVEVSCKTRQNIRMLANLLYDTAFSLRSPGSSTKLLEQKVPATYLALEDVISNLALELRGQGHDPVVRQDQYETMVSLFKSIYQIIVSKIAYSIHFALKKSQKKIYIFYSVQGQS